jgi:8-oxo-dGTP diphosphatase
MIRVAAAVIERDDRRILIGQRRAHDSSPLKWEFPGGKVEPGESGEQALARELREELGATLVRAAPIASTELEYPSGLIKVSFFAAEVAEVELRPTAFAQVAWVFPRELGEYDFLPANARLVAELATGRIKPADFLAPLPNEMSPSKQ